MQFNGRHMERQAKTVAICSFQKVVESTLPELGVSRMHNCKAMLQILATERGRCRNKVFPLARQLYIVSGKITFVSLRDGELTIFSQEEK